MITYMEQLVLVLVPTQGHITLTPFRSPVLISGPFVSTAMAMFLSATLSLALRTFSMVVLWYCKGTKRSNASQDKLQ